MHARLPFTGHNLPSKHPIRRLRKTLIRRSTEVTRLIILCFLLGIFHRKFYSVKPTGGGLGQCLSTHVLPLDTFDTFVREQKESGKVQNNFENRFQEDIWDTLIATALFPAWSDMQWNLPQYARSLSSDLSLVQAAATRALFSSVSSHDLKYNSPDSKISINYIHHRLDRLRGLQYMANYSPRNRSETYNLFLEQGFDDQSCKLYVSKKLRKRTVYVLLPYKDREERLRLFFENYLALTNSFGENLVLIVSVLRGSQQDKRVALELKAQVFNDYPEVARTVWLHENNGDVEHFFSRAVAIREASRLVPDDDDVIFHCDVDMIIHPTFFDRCRHNTIPGSQVYYPVFYSLYPYANANPKIVERNGFWRKTSFGMTCMRKRDFFAVGAYDDAETRFHGWGSEDVYQFEKVRNTTNLVAFRSVDPALLHRWHSKNCDTASEAYADCMKTNFATMGHPLKIGPVLLSSLRNVDEFFAGLLAS